MTHRDQCLKACRQVSNYVKSSLIYPQRCISSSYRGTRERWASLGLAVHVSGHTGAGRTLVHLPVVIGAVHLSLVHTLCTSVYGVDYGCDAFAL